MNISDVNDTLDEIIVGNIRIAVKNGTSPKYCTKNIVSDRGAMIVFLLSIFYKLSVTIWWL
jgi:hypothetical protein